MLCGVVLSMFHFGTKFDGTYPIEGIIRQIDDPDPASS